MKKTKQFRRKGAFSKALVLYCVRVMTWVLVWAIAFKCICTAFGICADISDVLGFAGAFFGGELILLAFKRICCKGENENECCYEETDEP